MKKIFVLLLIAFTILVNKNVFAEENDFDIYTKSIDNKIDFSQLNVIPENEYYKVKSKNKIEELKSFLEFSDVDSKVLTSTPQSYTYGSNLLSNGNFELGHSYWNEWYYDNGDWYDYDFIIHSGVGGYDNWFAWMTGNDWLVSNYNTTPNNTVDFRVSYNYKLNIFGTCSYGTNGVGVYLNDRTSDSFYVINSHDAEIDPYDYEYTSTSFLVSSRTAMNPVSGHDVYIDFLYINDDPNCSFGLHLDNVSVEPVVYIPDYTISTSAGANGSITSGTTLAQGSNYTVSITPNSGYEIANVLVDGVDVGPIKYYSFNNIQASHTVQANFQLINASSQRIYRFWGARGGHHFYTANDDELTYVVSNYITDIWRYEGVGYRAFTLQQSGTVPLYRFWSDQNQGHFYTASEDEKNYIIANYPERVWRYEGVAFYVYPADYLEESGLIHRFWSDQNQGHFYTASEDEKNYIIANYSTWVWRYEGTAYRVPIN